MTSEYASCESTRVTLSLESELGFIGFMVTISNRQSLSLSSTFWWRITLSEQVILTSCIDSRGGAAKARIWALCLTVELARNVVKSPLLKLSSSKSDLYSESFLPYCEQRNRHIAGKIAKFILDGHLYLRSERRGY